jgi:hypothetical protein
MDPDRMLVEVEGSEQAIKIHTQKALPLDEKNEHP